MHWCDLAALFEIWLLGIAREDDGDDVVCSTMAAPRLVVVGKAKHKRRQNGEV